MKNLARIAAVSAAATALIATAAPYAAAGRSVEAWSVAENNWQCSVKQGAAVAEFKAHGEHFYLSDRIADGHSARAVIRATVNGKYQWRRLSNSSGAGTKKHWNLAYPEGSAVRVTVWVGSERTKCGNVTATGWA